MKSALKWVPKVIHAKSVVSKSTNDEKIEAPMNLKIKSVTLGQNTDGRDRRDIED